MDRIATNAVAKALELEINEDCENGFLNTKYTYTGRVFKDVFGKLYYEMTVTERGRELVKPAFLYPLGGSYMETTERGLTIVED